MHTSAGAYEAALITNDNGCTVVPLLPAIGSILGTPPAGRQHQNRFKADTTMSSEQAREFILFVKDNPSVGEEMRASLREGGHSFTEVALLHGFDCTAEEASNALTAIVDGDSPVFEWIWEVLTGFVDLG